MLGSMKTTLPDNADLRGVIQNLAERWNKMDVLLYTVAYVLTPRYHSDHWLKKLAPCGKKRKKPDADPDVQKVYLDVVDQLVTNSKEASLIRQQLNTGSFSCSQAIKDRDIKCLHYHGGIYMVRVLRSFTVWQLKFYPNALTRRVLI